MRVLIAEDDKTFCEFLKETLEMKGIEVVSSANGCEGHQKALSARFDYFVLDVRMPGLSGTDLAALLKRMIRTLKLFSYPRSPIRRCATVL